MAIRKKTETIHLRVEPITKAYLEALGNASGKTSTQVLEDLLKDAAAKFIVDGVGECVDCDALKNGNLDLKTAVDSALVDHDVILTKLRTFYIAKEALSTRDEIIADAIIASEELFFGQSEIFAIDEKIVKSDFVSKTPKLNLHEISRRMRSLEDFGAFREKNPNWRSTYQEFLKMTGEE